MIEQRLSAKDFDAFASFLGRLKSIGSSYIRKNDVILATVKGNKSGGRGKIPGKHIIKDPLFIDDDDAYIKDAIYYTPWSLNQLIDIFKSIKENKKELRKDIYLLRDKEGLYIEFCHDISQRYQIFGLINSNYLTDAEFNHYLKCGSGITWFDDVVNTIGGPFQWTNFTEDELISLRNDSIMVLRQTIKNIPLFARIARSVFVLSGVTRKGMPLAEKARYALLPPSENENKDIGLLRIHTVHKSPGGSKLINVEVIHDYMILIYNEEDGINERE